MLRFTPLLLLLAACSQQPAAPTLETGSFAGPGRDRLCIAGTAGNYRAGLIAFGSGNSNCSAAGRLELDGGKAVLVPRGEGPCRIALSIEGDVVRIEPPAKACSYYCGPGASLEGKSFTRTPGDEGASDLAGDPLC